MDNPYQAPTAPLAPPIDDQPADKSMVIDSVKGPITLAARNDSFTVSFNGATKSIPAKKFVTSVILLFWKTKRVAVKSVKANVEVSEQKFLELLTFYGVERFKEHDIKTARIINGCAGAFLSGMVLLGMSKLDMWSPQDVAAFAFGIVLLALSLLSFSRLYLIYYALNSLVNLLFSCALGLLFYRDGGWWIPFILFFTLVAFWSNLQKFIYFRKIT